MRARGWGSWALTNCGRKAKKKIESFGFYSSRGPVPTLLAPSFEEVPGQA
jgi:hypothetical protein